MQLAIELTVCRFNQLLYLIKWAYMAYCDWICDLLYETWLFNQCYLLLLNYGPTKWGWALDVNPYTEEFMQCPRFGLTKRMQNRIKKAILASRQQPQSNTIEVLVPNEGTLCISG